MADLGAKFQDTPTLKVLSNALDSVVNWYSLGVKLGLEDHDLRTIERNYRGDGNERCKLEMLSRWLRRAKRPTWKAVVDALQQMGEQAVAFKILAKYCSSSSATASATPTLKALVNELNRISYSDWHILGVNLDLNHHLLKTIEKSYGYNHQRCMTEVLICWLDIATNPMWEAVAEALDQMKQCKIADDIRKKYIISSSTTTKGQGTEQDFPEYEVQMKVAPEFQGQFGYRIVKLLKTKPLGRGSYGAVYKAMCDDLACAGKILHPTLFQSDDPGAMVVMKRFEQECSFLSAVRHPNIVQYLGVHQDPATQLPVLLMELMDESLTQLLKRSQEPLPYHTQVDICHDIALALAYLHSNGIIHRDLSSNNVLLIGRNKAKVTDFGMAKFFDANRTSMTPLTVCPGTLAYMSPEALQDQPVYTKKLDTFSFGVLDIQIITRQLPNPGPRLKKVQDPRYPMGTVQVAIPDTERRKSHIDLINPSHPLLPIATVCLSYNEEDRPSAQRLCHQLAVLKEAPQYSDSVQQATTDREKQIMKLQQKQKESNEQIQDLQHQLKVRDSQIREKDAVIAARQQEMQQLQVTREKDRDIEIKEQQLQRLNQQLTASQQVTAQLKTIIQESQEEKEHLQQELDKVLQQSMVTQKGSIDGVQVIGEVGFTVPAEGGSFHWRGYGLRLHIPKDSLTAKCRIDIKVSLSGQFQLPEGLDLLSPVFWILAPCKFAKPVTLEIQHCALTEDESSLSGLSFVSAKCSQGDLPYKFIQMDGAVFTTHSPYGSIQLSHFSGIGIAGRKKRSYCAHLYHTMKQMYQWRFYFVITQDLDATNTVVREHYGCFAQEATLRVTFEHSEITLDIPDDGLVTREGWRITPFSHPTISRKDVDKFKKGQWIPECQLVVQWERKDQRPVQLRQKVDLTGAKAPHNFIYLILNPPEQVQKLEMEKACAASDQKLETGRVSTKVEMRKVYHRTIIECREVERHQSTGSSGSMEYSQDEQAQAPVMKDLMDALYNKVAAKWEHIGIYLHLPMAALKAIAEEHQRDPHKCLIGMLEVWLKRVDPSPTWSAIVEAVEFLGEEQLGKKLREKY